MKFGITVLGLGLVVLLLTSASDIVGPRMGIIPGTSMSRDEFRARAQAELAALALDAVTYQIANGSYPKDFETLIGSKAYNLRLINMFNNRPVQSIYFEPSSKSMTNDPPLDVNDLNFGPPVINAPGQGGDESGGGGKMGPQQPGPPIDMTGADLQSRVDPKAITDFQAGDVFYYANGDMLQLVMFAPDGTFLERVDQIPSANYRINLQLRQAQPPENIYAAEVLYYVETLAGQHYNLVQFMGDGQTIPGATISELPGSKKIELASRIGVKVYNPVTRKPETASKTASPGEIAEGSPLKIRTMAGPVLSLDDMTVGDQENAQPSGPPPAKPQETKPKPKPGQKPPGGHTPGAPGGGRHG